MPQNGGWYGPFPILWQERRVARILVCALSAPCPAEETPLKSYENVVVVRGAAAAASCFPMALSPELGL